MLLEALDELGHLRRSLGGLLLVLNLSGQGLRDSRVGYGVSTCRGVGMSADSLSPEPMRREVEANVRAKLMAGRMAMAREAGAAARSEAAEARRMGRKARMDMAAMF